METPPTATYHVRISCNSRGIDRHWSIDATSREEALKIAATKVVEDETKDAAELAAMMSPKTA